MGAGVYFYWRCYPAGKRDGSKLRWAARKFRYKTRDYHPFEPTRVYHRRLYAILAKIIVRPAMVRLGKNSCENDTPRLTPLASS